MVRVKNIEESKKFYCDLLGLKEIKRKESEEGKFTLVFLAAPNQEDIALELTYNWNTNEIYSEGRNFGHLAFEVSDIYEICIRLQKAGVIINRPPRDGRMAFVRSPDNISIELLQTGNPLEIQEPWKSMKSIGHW
jgi:lactoylglutathione lyase|tara:strand:- start:92 stop:496 length:405 start_codon:yes stop_codon:yes gene_type:complete